jgi:hypothetical protein
VTSEQANSWLHDLSLLVEARNVHGLITELVAIPEYVPSREIMSLCSVDRYDQALAYNLARASLSSAKEPAA